MTKIKKKKETIAAVVVTYNRKELLKKCLNSLLVQKPFLALIIIVDNASTDGTAQLLKKNFLDNPIFDYQRLDNNTGGSGGFYYGMKRAFEEGYEWIWVMDDDVIAAPNAVKSYLKYKKSGKFIQGRRKIKGDGIFEWAQRLDPKTGEKKQIDEQKAFKKNSFIKVNVACFEGAFIHRDVIREIGLPNREFFIAGDDTLYGYRASGKFDIFYIKDVTLIRQRQVDYQFILEKKFAKRSPLSLYYKFRNMFLLENEIKKTAKTQKVNHKLMIARKEAKEFLKILLTQKNKKNLLRALFYATRDGINKNFQPRRYFDYL